VDAGVRRHDGLGIVGWWRRDPPFAKVFLLLFFQKKKRLLFLSWVFRLVWG
jgi:hypothetical protein